MQKIIYGTDTCSIEAYDQCVVLLIPSDVEDVEEYIEERGLDGIPQRPIITGDLDLALLRRQTIALDNVLGRCDDDADSPAVTVYIEEAELLEGLLNLCAGLLEHSTVV